MARSIEAMVAVLESTLVNIDHEDEDGRIWRPTSVAHTLRDVRRLAMRTLNQTAPEDLETRATLRNIQRRAEERLASLGEE